MPIVFEEINSTKITIDHKVENKIVYQIRPFMLKFFVCS